MAQQTLQLPAANFIVLNQFRTWFFAAGSRLEIDASLVPSGTSRFLERFRIDTFGMILVDLTNTQDGPGGANHDLSTMFESSGSVELTPDGYTGVRASIDGADTSEPYQWTPSNSLKVAALATAITETSDLSATLVIRDFIPEAHAVDAGNVFNVFAVPQPAVSRTRGRNAGDVAFAFAIPEPTGGIFKRADAGDVAVAFAVPEPTVSRTRGRNAGDVAFAFAIPEPTISQGFRRDAGDALWAFAVSESVRVTYVTASPDMDTFVPSPQETGPTINIASRIDLLLPQYNNAVKLQALTRNLIGIVQAEIVDPLQILERAMNPDESEGILLDWLGERLGFPRPYAATEDTAYLGFEGTEADVGKTFGQAPFFTLRGHIENVEPIGDRWYRLMLKARARRLRGGANRETIEAVLAILFGNGYLNESTTPMQLVVVTENNFLYSLVSGSQFGKLIPRPAGRAMTMARG